MPLKNRAEGKRVRENCKQFLSSSRHPDAVNERALSSGVPGTRGFRVLGWSSAREYRGPQAGRCCTLGVGVGRRDLVVLRPLTLHA